MTHFPFLKRIIDPTHLTCSASYLESYPEADTYLKAGYPAGKRTGQAVFVALAIFNFCMVVFPYIGASHGLTGLVEGIKELEGIKGADNCSFFSTGKNCYFCPLKSMLVLACIFLPLMQLRSLHSVGGLVKFSVISITIPTVIVLVSLWSNGKPSGAEYDSSIGPIMSGTSKENFMNFTGQMFSFMFCFSWQFLQPNLIAEMKEPKDFPKAVWTATGVATLLLLVVACSMYGTLGAATPGFLLDYLTNKYAKIVANLFLTLHTMVATCVNSIAFNSTAVTYVARALGRNPEDKFCWAVSTSVTLAVAFVVGNIIKFFDALENLMGASFCSATSFIFPLLFVAWAPKFAASEEKKKQYFWVAVAWSLATCVGTYCALEAIVVAIEDSAVPFSCSLPIHNQSHVNTSWTAHIKSKSHLSFCKQSELSIVGNLTTCHYRHHGAP